MDKLDMQSVNITDENIEKIGNLFPNVIVESENGKTIDFDLLKQELSKEIVEGNKEKYQLTWPGKKEAILTANTPTLPLNLLRVRLDETSPSSVTGTSALLSDVPPYTLGESLKTSEGIDTSYNLVEGTLAPGKSVTYNLRLWIDESAGKDVMNDSFTGRVLVYSYM